MSKFVVLISAILIAFVGFVVINKSNEPKVPLLGTQHPNLGGTHLTSLTQAHKAYNSQLPSSGDHMVEEAPWGVRTEAVPDEQLVHNEEHGGIVIAYKPDLPKAQIEELQKIATNLTSIDSPQAIKGFKVLMFPRSKNEKPIQLASWNYTLDLDQVNAETIKTFYRQHLNKSPEPRAS
jgi:hypothetical protein